MKNPIVRCLLFALALAASTRHLSAHFVFVHIVRGPDARIELHFAESAWDFTANARMIGLIDTVRGFAPGGRPLIFERRAFGLTARLDEDQLAAFASITYGCIERGGEPFLLEYHAKGVGDLAAAGSNAGLRAEILATPAGADRLTLTVLFDGKPAKEAEIVVPTVGVYTEKLQTDANGQVVIAKPSTPLFAIRAMVAEQREGEHDGKSYALARHYTTLTVQDTAAAPAGSDSLAWALLADASQCCAGLPDQPSDWSATYRASLDGENTSGRLTGRGSSATYGRGEQHVSPALTRQLQTMSWPSHPLEQRTDIVRFASGRTATAHATIELPRLQRSYVVRDRHLAAESRVHDDRIERLDISDWKMSHDERLLPRQLAFTVFASTGAILSVSLLERDYSELGNLYGADSQRGRVIESATSIRTTSVRLSNLRIGAAAPR